MKNRVVISVLSLLLFCSGFLYSQVVDLQWNTFLGSADIDYCYAIAQDGSGNLYITGRCDAGWGSPIIPYSGTQEAYVVCLDSSGNLVWNTFLGGLGNDHGVEIVLDSSGNIYVVGYSDATWGSPVSTHGSGYDAFVAKLDSSGNLLWNTFLGSYGWDFGNGIALDTSGNIYIAGDSNASWGSPIYIHLGGYDIFAAKLDNSGNLLWNTFLGCSGQDSGRDIALDGSGNIYITGYGDGYWGFPVNPYNNQMDVIVACLDNTGHYRWNTFLGAFDDQLGHGIALDSAGNVYVVGEGVGSWGSPVNPHGGLYDAFAACLDNSGNLLWNTFMGGTGSENAKDLIVDSLGNVYITGFGNATWGSPLNAYSGNMDAFLACLDSSGSRVWNTFLGSSDNDRGEGIVLDSSGNLYMAGYSHNTWGMPLNPHNSDYDIFVAGLFIQPLTDITANGSDGPVSITDSDTLQIRVSLNGFGITDDADYWLAYKGPSGWVHYNNTSKTWDPGLGVTHQGPLMALYNKKVFQAKLSPGSYTFYFGIDLNMNGKVTKSSLYKDEVQVTVNASSN